MTWRQAGDSLGIDGPAWDKLMRPFVERWNEFAPEILRPVSFCPAASLADGAFWNGRACSRRRRSLAAFATREPGLCSPGCAAHSFLALDEPLSAAFAILMAVPAHAVGWPIPRGGAQSITNALCSFLSTFGGTVKTSIARPELWLRFEDYDLFLCDLTPRQLVKVAGKNYRKAISGD